MLQTRSISDPFQLSSGDHVLRLVVERGGLHLDAFHLRPFRLNRKTLRLYLELYIFYGLIEI